MEIDEKEKEGEEKDVTICKHGCRISKDGMCACPACISDEEGEQETQKKKGELENKGTNDEQGDKDAENTTDDKGIADDKGNNPDNKDNMIGDTGGDVKAKTFLDES